MARKHFTRSDIQTILESNLLEAKAYYTSRPSGSLDNVIVYYRLTPNNPLTADDTRHLRKVLVQVTHFHKKPLDNIEELMLENFNTEPIAFDLVQPETDYLATHYRFEILTTGDW